MNHNQPDLTTVPEIQKSLWEHIERLFIPELNAAGFSRDNRSCHGMDYYALVRVVGEEEQSVSIYVEGGHLGRFVISLYKGPDSTSLPSGAKCLVGSVQKKHGKSRKNWFCGRPTMLDRLKGRTAGECARKAVQESLAALSEIEAWWENQQPSRYIDNRMVPAHGK